VRVGDVGIGGGAPVSVQSMTNTDTRDVQATIGQIRRLEEAGCQIVRIAVPDEAAARSLAEIKATARIPIVADIHFDHRLALIALESGVDKLRINPGNIGSVRKVKEVAQAAAERGVPIRIGANAGSIDRAKYGEPTAAALAASAIDQAKMLEDIGFRDVVLSMKAFDVPMTIEAYRIVADRTAYPLHLGVTEAGLPWEGTIRSAVGIGTLLAEGIGDTLRVSLTGDPVEEVLAGFEILAALDLYVKPLTLICCPTCGRCRIDIPAVAAAIRERVGRMNLSRPIKIAVMGCSVNGPGEAAMADVGVAGGEDFGLLFARGKPLRKVAETAIVDELASEVERFEGDTQSEN
jgi:(E)-4-hydroxy-3-methylbut-2-enyl-diphosphate synthase